MRMAVIFAIGVLLAPNAVSEGADRETSFSGQKKQNNLACLLLEAPRFFPDRQSFTFTRSSSGWIWISLTFRSYGEKTVVLDPGLRRDVVLTHRGFIDTPLEAMHYVGKGEHEIRVETDEVGRVDRLVVKAIPELIHCGLGYDPAIKAFGHYDLNFLKRDILPNVTTLIVPANFQLPQAAIDSWHHQGKRFVAEVGIDS